MKIFVKTLKDTHFEIDVKPEDMVADVKKKIETIQGSHNSPAAKQLLIYEGKVLENDTTLQDNKVAENSFIVIVLTKTKGSNGEGSSSISQTAKTKGSPDEGFSISVAPTAKVPKSKPLAAPSPIPPLVSPAAPPAPTPTTAPALSSALAPTPAPAAPSSPTLSETGAYGQGASNDVVTNLNHTVEQILDMGGGTWDRDTVLRALQAAHDSPERAVEYLYSGIPEQDISAVPSSGSNANIQDIFPQGFPRAGSSNGGAGVLDFLRHSPKFQALRAIVQANPQMLQPMLQELGKQNPQVVRLIQENHADFLRLVNEPIEGGEENIIGQLGTPTPQAIQVTPAEHAAIERLEAMGFDRATVLEVYFACNKNEGLAANYLLDHLHELED